MLVKGARQVGKTYIIRKFGHENYANFIEINFSKEPQLISAFEGNLDVETIFSGISAIRRDFEVIPGNTLLFLDELQDCPNARTAFKFLAEDGRCGVVASGSLLGIKYKYRKRRELKEPKSIPVGYKLTDGNVGAVGKKITLPHYMAMFIRPAGDLDRRLMV